MYILMKRIFISLICLLVAFVCRAQFPITQNLGSSSTLVQVPANGGLRAGLINRVFADTTAANLSNLDFYDGAQIKTLTPINAVWWRDSTNTRWVQILPAGGSSGTLAWVMGGNNPVVSDGSGNAILGPQTNNGIAFMSNNTQRVILPASGLTFNQVVGDTTLNKPMTYNTSTKNWGYGYWYGGGSGATPTWQQTLTAGSTLTTDNAVTSDQDFIWTSDQILGDGEWSIIGSASKLLKADLSGISSQLGVTSGYSVTMSTANQSDNHVGSFFEVFVDSIGMGPYLGVFAIDTLNNYSAQNTLIGWVSTSGADRGRVGYVTLSGLTLSGGVLTNPNPTPGANTALSNLSSVAINTSLLPGVDNSIDIGSGTFRFRNGIYGTGVAIGTTAAPLSKLDINGGDVYQTYNTGSPRYLIGDGVASGSDYGGLKWLSGTDALAIGVGGSSQENIVITTTGAIGINRNTATALLHIKEGVATANGAPFKLTTGTNLTTAEAGAMEYTTPQLFFTNGGAVRQELFQGQQSRVSTQFDKTSDVALANVTGLTANVAAGKIYRFEAKLYTTSNVAGGVKVAIGGTATATAIIYEGLTTDAGLTTQSRSAALGTAVGAVTAVTAGYVVITGTITVNAAGTLTVQFAQNASNGTASSVLVGSTFLITEML